MIFFVCWFNYSGHLVSPEDVVTCLLPFCSNCDVDSFKRIAVLRTLEQVSWYICIHLHSLYS